MKNYQVFYWIKTDSREYLEYMFVSANTAKDACRIAGYAERDHQREKALAVSPFGSPRFNRYARLKEREV